MLLAATAAAAAAAAGRALLGRNVSCELGHSFSPSFRLFQHQKMTY